MENTETASMMKRFLKTEYVEPQYKENLKKNIDIGTNKLIPLVTELGLNDTGTFCNYDATISLAIYYSEEFMIDIYFKNEDKYCIIVENSSKEIFFRIDMDYNELVRKLKIILNNLKTFSKKNSNDILNKRFDEISKLQDGWLDGDGVRIDNTTYTTIYDFVESNYLILPEKISVFPEPNGGVMLEFNLNGYDISLNSNPDKTVYLHAMSLKDNKEVHEGTFSAFDDEEILKKFVSIIEV